ncbi:GntR family transcriptional regulator [Leifsonia sp. NPDC056665]|uniref:GntR family transcriptional regulator n=1 Tax=Leifsonia sp. NPDC056665 TaxID=3345901 RepID=UPI0036CA5B73
MATGWKIRSEAEEQSLEERTATRLRALVQSGSIAEGEQLMSEPELARTLGVSRPTLRVAISILVADRLLVRKRGVGTFVAADAPSFSNGFERIRGTSEMIAVNGQVPGVVGLDVQHEFADARIAESLGIAEGAAVVRIRRTFLADGIPVMFAEEWIPTEFLESPTRFDDFTTEDSLYERLADQGLAVHRITARFVPMNAGVELAHQMSTQIGTPILLLEQHHYVDSVPDRVVMFSKNYHEPSRIDIQIVRRG